MGFRQRGGGFLKREEMEKVRKSKRWVSVEKEKKKKRFNLGGNWKVNRQFELKTPFKKTIQAGVPVRVPVCSTPVGSAYRYASLSF